MSSPTSILTTLSDFTDKNKHEHYDSNTCKNIQTKLDEEIKSQGLSYEERFQLVRSSSNRQFNFWTNHSSSMYYRQEKISLSPINGVLFFQMVFLNAYKNIGKNV